MTKKDIYIYRDVQKAQNLVNTMKNAVSHLMKCEEKGILFDNYNIMTPIYYHGRDDDLYSDSFCEHIDTSKFGESKRGHVFKAKKVPLNHTLDEILIKILDIERYINSYELDPDGKNMIFIDSSEDK